MNIKGASYPYHFRKDGIFESLLIVKIQEMRGQYMSRLEESAI